MKRLLAFTLGILTAVGGFADIGDIVANAQAGARYGLGLAWVVVVGVIGICAFAEMSTRLVIASGRPVYDIIRERLGARVAFANLGASMIVTILTLAAQIGGLALIIELLSGIPHVIWLAPVAFAVWLMLWRVKFQHLERVLGVFGLTIVVFGASIWWLDPDWSALADQAMSFAPEPGEPLPTYLFYAVAIFAAAMTPYEVFFFSSSGVEEGWKPRDLKVQRADTFIGFPIGGLVSIGIAGAAAVAIRPLDADVSSLGQVLLPPVLAFGTAGLIIALIAFAAVMTGAAMETGLSCGYTLAQYFGWSWGKRLRPKRAARFHVALGLSFLVALAVVQTGVDPVRITEFALLGSAVALPLTYLPVLVVANDRQYMGDHVNGRLSNTVGLVIMVVVVVAALAAIPLMIGTGMGA